MKKNKFIIIGLIVVAIVFITGASFALWQITLQQNSINTITTSCFKIEFQDENPIHLSSAYPISDEEGKNLVPYEFTITNTCDSYASYQVHLEILNDTDLNRYEFIKSNLNENVPRVLTQFIEAEKTLDDAVKSYKLETEFLDPNETKEFELRLWLDEETPAIDEVMNKTFESKITIITSFVPTEPTFSERIIACSEGNTTAKCMIENSKYDTVDLAYDETIDNNLRYIGSDPNNYVEFNDELWRIVGVMENVEDGQGNLDSRIKLIRNESIGEYSWDSSSNDVNGGRGVNEWSVSDLNILLNDYYYNRKTEQFCLNGVSNQGISCNFDLVGLLDDSKLFIDNSVWHLGSIGESEWQKDTALVFYNSERGNNTGKICSSGTYCNDTVERTTTWIGKVGLMYVSDYGFATSGGSTSRATCLDTAMYNWYTSSFQNCYNNNWLYKSSIQWSMVPLSYSSHAYYTLYINSIGNVNYNGATYPYSVSPVVYLNSDVKIISGTGEEGHPYILSMN